MLCKLAWGNVRRARRDYLVYLLTLALGVTVFYAFNTISMQVDIAGLDNKGIGDSLGMFIYYLTMFLACVLGFLMVYANNFIMKRRKKEFGLYQVLGMSRWQVARVMVVETVIVSAVAFAVGILAGVGLSQLMVFFTGALFKTQIANFHFFFSVRALVLTLECLVGVFALTLVFNLRVVARARVIDLMSAGRAGERVRVRNPWISAGIFVVGAALIGVAYHRLIVSGLPVMMDDPAEMTRFGITTVMVVAGTVMFFFGLSGFLLKVLQAARGVYWRGLNPFTLRQLSSRVNTVSLSMAVIAMILFLAITSVTTGMSIAKVMSENLERSTPADYSRTFTYYSEDSLGSVNENRAEGEAPAVSVSEPLDLLGLSAESDMVELEDDGSYKTDANGDTISTGERFDLEGVAGRYVQVDFYEAFLNGGKEPAVSFASVLDAAQGEHASLLSAMGEQGMAFISQSAYNAYRAFRGMDPISLGEDGYLITSDAGATLNSVYEDAMENGFAPELGGHVLHPASTKVDAASSSFTNNTSSSNAGTMVVPDAVLESIDARPHTSCLLVDYRDDMPTAEGDEYVSHALSFTSATHAGTEVGYWGASFTRTELYQSSDDLNGLVSYLAVYIGFVLVVACAAILTIQQLSSVADAGTSVRLLSELGTPTAQIRRSFLAQQAVFFCFPLAVGIAHSVVALRVVVDLVEVFGHLSIAGTATMACAIFFVAYGGYFLLTYAMSKNILRDAIAARH